MEQMRIFLVKRQRTLRAALMLGFAMALGAGGAFAAENGNNLPWEGPLTTLVTSLTGPVAYAISVVAIVALGATLAFAGGEMGETMKRLAARWHCRVLRGLRRPGDGHVHRSGCGDRGGAACPRDCPARPRLHREGVITRTLRWGMVDDSAVPLLSETSMNEPEQTIMRTSLSRPQQLLGGDREMVIMTGLGAAMMAVSVMTFLSFLLAIVGFWLVVGVLARIGKADPMMRKVYSRHLQYKDFYPAKSGVAAFGKTPKRGWR